MLNKRDKQLVNIAWDVVEKFISDWKNSPYAWDNERDVQVEIASRLKQAYGKKNNYKAHYTKWATEGYKQLYSRVSCEPLVHYTDSKGIRERCHPDIAVFKDFEDSN